MESRDIRKHVSCWLGVPLALMIVGCEVSDDTFDSEIVPEVNSRLQLAKGGPILSQGRYFQITPDGELTSCEYEEPKKIPDGKRLYRQVVSLLAPLRTYSGTEGNHIHVGRPIECKKESNSSLSVIIDWGNSGDENISDAQALPNFSEFEYSCRSEKADAAISRIEEAIGLMEKSGKSSEYCEELAQEVSE